VAGDAEEGDMEDSVVGRSIMGLVPPFGWRDVETFEGDVAHIQAFSYLALCRMLHSRRVSGSIEPAERARLTLNQS